MNDANTPSEAAAAPVADPTKARIVAEWKHESPLVACRFDPTGEFVFTAAQDNTVQRWRLADGAKTALPAVHDSWVHAIAFDASGETLLTGGCDGRLVWWPARVDAPAAARVVDAHAGWIRALATSPGGECVATASNDLTARLWNVADGSLVREFAGHEKNVYSVVFHPAGEAIVTGDLAGVVRHWETATGKLVRQFDAKTLYSYNGGQQVDFGGVRGLGFSADAARLAAGGLYEASNPLGAVHDPIVEAFDWESGEKKQTHTTKDKLKGVVWRCVYHPEGWLMAVSGGSSGGYLLFWKPDEAQEFAAFQLPNIARDMDLHPDRIRVATAHHDGHVRITELRAAPA